MRAVTAAERTFRGANIRPPPQQAGRVADIDQRREGRNGRGRSQFGFQRGGLLSGQDAEAMNGMFDGGLQRREGGQGGLELGVCAGGVQFGGASRVQAWAVTNSKVWRPIIHIGSGHGQFVLLAAQLEVVAGDLGDKGDQHVLAVGLAGGQVRLGGFHRAADMAEEIEFPGGIEAGVVQTHFAVRARVSGNGSASLGRGGFGPAGDGVGEGIEAGHGGQAQGAGFEHAGGGDAQVLVGGDGTLDQAD